ncbi:MAG: sugar kinase [Nitrospinae bacterium]|nr:sugar kinase [Nitrospinota bacterium]
MTEQKGKAKDLLVVGTVAIDSVKTPFGEADSVLGGSATYFSVASSYFTSVRLVAVVGEDFPDDYLGVFKKHNVDTSGLVRMKGETFRWRGAYGYDLNVANTLETKLNVLTQFDPALTEEEKSTPFVFLANIDPDLQIKVINQLKAPRLVALDSMNFWIENKKKSLQKAISMVDMIILNEGEARELTGHSNLVKAAKEVRIMGPKTVIIKQGEYGSLGMFGDEIFSAPAYPLEDVFDPTGAGDTFAGGVMGYLARHGGVTGDIVRQAMIVGSALASYNVEAFSLQRLTDLQFNDIVSRYNEIKRLTVFEDFAH